MAENRQIFDEAMARAREYQAKDQWESAFREYYKAATEYKNDLDARAGLALSLLKLRRGTQALAQYQVLVRYRAADLSILRGYAEALAETGRSKEAIDYFYKLRDLAKQNGFETEQIEALSDIIELDESRTDAYLEVIEIYMNRGDNVSAASVGIELARHYHKIGDNSQALEVLDDVVKINPDNPDAPALRSSIEAAGTLHIDLPPLGEPDGIVELPDLGGLEPLVTAATPSVPAATAEPEEPPREEPYHPLIHDAETALEQGNTILAIRNYELAVEAGATGADIHYSLGSLYLQEGNLDKAIENLKVSTNDADYAASAFFALGNVFEQREELDEAASNYESALRLIDLTTIGETEIDELVGMYDQAAGVYLKQANESKAAALYTKLAGFVTSRGFRTEKSTLVLIKAREMNEKAVRERVGTGKLMAVESHIVDTPPVETHDYLSEEGLPDEVGDNEVNTGSTLPGFSNTISFASNSETKNGSSENGLEETEDYLTDDAFGEPIAPVGSAIPAIFPDQMIGLEPNPAIGPYIRAAKDFMDRDLLMAAMDACHEVIRYYPDYLPAQAVLAELFVKKGWFDQARSKYQFIVDLYNMREVPDRSVLAFRRLVEISPDNIGLRSKLANHMMANGMKSEAAELMLTTIDSYVQTGQTEKALEECKKLRSLAPNSAPIRIQYGELLNRLEKHQEALGEFRRALELDPDNIKTLCLLNITLLVCDQSEVRWTSLQTVLDAINNDKEKQSKVLNEYRQSLFIFNHAALNYVMGCLYQEAGLKLPSIRTYEDTLKMVLGDSKVKEFEVLVRYELGQLYLDNGRAPEAVEELTKVASMLEGASVQLYAPSTMRYGSLPTQLAIYRKLAQAFNRQGQVPYALKALKTVKRLLPYDRDVYFELAELHFQQGQLNEALGELGELADHYEQLNQTDKVVEVLKEMVRLAPNRIEVRDKLSQVYLNRGMIDDGLSEIDELAELQRKNGRMKDAVRSLQKGAEIYFMMGRQDKAYELYDRIVRIAPGDIEARQQLVNLHILAMRLPDAINEQRTIAQICLQTGNTNEAIGALHQVIGLAPEDTRAYFQLADVLKSVGEYGQAYKLYGRVIKLEPNNDKAKSLQAQIKQKAIDAGQLKG